MIRKRDHRIPLGLSPDLPEVQIICVKLCFRKMCMATRFISNPVPGLCMYNIQSMRCTMQDSRIYSRAIRVNWRPARSRCVLQISRLRALRCLSAESLGHLRWTSPCKNDCRRCPWRSENAVISVDADRRLPVLAPSYRAWKMRSCAAALQLSTTRANIPGKRPAEFHHGLWNCVLGDHGCPWREVWSQPESFRRET